jgi:uncharacterized protein (TIGR02453 family)
MTDFVGFPIETTDFLSDLAANNSKTWFDAHRSEYEQYWLEPAREFVEAGGEELASLTPGIQAEPRVNGSIFRINRDVRFSKDKTPYKTTLDFWFWQGTRRNAVSGYYMRIAPAELGIGVGAHGFDKDRLAAFRAAVVDSGASAALREVVGSVESAGWPVMGEHYKQLPRGFEAADAFQERFLRYSALWTGEDTPQPKSLRSRRLVPYVMNRWTKLEPLHRWLVDRLQ